MNWDDIESDLKKKLSPKRYQHTLNVVEAAEKLALNYGYNVEKASFAALLHDCAKCFSDQALIAYAESHHVKVDTVSLLEPQLLHAPVGAVVARETYAVTDTDIQDAICYHTTGRKNMSTLEKIIYLSDFIEKDRSFNGIETIRRLAFISLDKAMIEALTNSICHVAEVGSLIHKRTIQARNDLIISEMKRNKENKKRK